MINYFAVIFKNVNNQTLHEFIIYNNRNDIHELYNFLKQHKNDYLAGYNNFNYDDQLMIFIYYNYHRLFKDADSSQITATLHALSTNIIEEKHTKLYNPPFISIDLMKVNYLYKSLKLVAVNLNWSKIQDMPLHHTHFVVDEDLEMMHKYNLNDVLITEQLYYASKDEIALRWEIGKRYGVNVISESRSGIANRILEKLYSDKTGIPIKELKEMRTDRNIIHFENIIYPNVHFDTPELNSVLYKLLRMVYYKGQPFIKKNILFNGMIYRTGRGGIHSDDRPGFFESNDKEDIIDCDVTSMYANNMIINNLIPAHLGPAFMEIYKDITKRRIDAKKRGDKLESEALKIVILSVWGKTFKATHWLYDPLVGLRLVINGQLYILMLIEKLVTNNFRVISTNTDGIVTIVPKDKRNQYNEICANWCKETKFDLEFTEYKKYIAKDVNNYIAIKKDGDIKVKGDFVQQIDLIRGVDKPIVSKALYDYFIKGIKPEDTVRQCKNILQFCTAKKTDDKFDNYRFYIEDYEIKREKLQNTVRFFVAKSGDQLYKVDKKTGETINYCAGYNIEILNDVDDTNISKFNVNHNYYISECYKVINQIEDKQLKLF
jgi:hypothetical protein